MTVTIQGCSFPCWKAAVATDIPGGLSGKHGPREPRRETLESKRKDLTGAACSKLLYPPAPGDSAAPPDGFPVRGFGVPTGKGFSNPCSHSCSPWCHSWGTETPAPLLPSPAPQSPAAAPTHTAESVQGCVTLMKTAPSMQWGRENSSTSLPLGWWQRNSF